MSIKEKLSERPMVGPAVVAVLLLGTAAMVWFSIPSGTREPSMPSHLYFSDDDGKTFYIDDSDKIAPYDHAGKPAMQAALFECGGKKFVGYLIRYDNSTKATLEAMSVRDRHGAKAVDMRQVGEMVKKPGGKDWIPLKADRPVGQIVSPPCPDGSDETPKLVTP